MKIAIYSRIVDDAQHGEVQQLFDELKRQKIEPVIYHSFLEKMGTGFVLPHQSSIFRESADLDESIEFVISLGGDGTLLDTVALVRD
jgi:NAD+ kinase